LGGVQSGGVADDLYSEDLNTLGLDPKIIEKVKAFIPGNKPQNRRRGTDWDAGRGKDRRKSGVALRLKTGIWLQFHRKTGMSKFQLMEFAERGDLQHAVISESENYQFSERGTGTLLLPGIVATSAVDHACSAWTEKPAKDRQAVLLIDEIAEYILKHYDVRMIDRRGVRDAGGE
jgi:hypothetical protein